MNEALQVSTQIQDEKLMSLESFEQNCEEFISEVIHIDREVADIVKLRKEEFYGAYSYLKPEIEQDWKEKAADWFESLREWCKEHWKAIVTVVIVIVAVVLICTGVGGILGAMALGALWGVGIGGLSGGIMSAITGGSFWEGLENGMFSGAIAGIISGGMGFALSIGGKSVLSLGQSLVIGGVSGSSTSLISDLGDKYIKGEEIALGNVLENTILSGVAGIMFSGFGYGISRTLGKLFSNVKWFSTSRELFRIGKTQDSKYGRITAYTTPKTRGISLNFSNSTGKTIIRIEFDLAHYLHYHCPLLLPTRAHIPLAPIIDSITANNVIDNWSD